MTRAPGPMFILMVCLAAGGCAASPRPADPARDAGTPTFEQIAGGTYSGIAGEAVRLIDGTYEGPPFTAGAASRLVVTLLREPLARGDLDGDGRDEAVVLLVRNDGGSGLFLHLAVVAARGDTVVNLDTILIGDRVRPESLAVEGGVIRLRALEHAGGDPQCCPTRETIREWTLGGGRLIAGAIRDAE